MLLPISNKEFVEDMLLATELAGRVLEYAANRGKGGYDIEDFKRKTQDGVWLARKKPIRDALKKTLKLTQKERKDLWEAVDNDIHFYEKLDDPAFEFKYRGLPAAARHVGDELLLRFYEILKKPGFSKLTGQRLKKLDGTLLEELYRQGNKNCSICPACLMAFLPPAVKRISQNDREHYFPQSLYPSLAVHPYNLAISCIPCNQRRHSNIDPISKHKAGALLDSFLPYSRPGIEDVELRFSPENKEMVRLSGKQGRARAVARARNFDRMYQLSTFWSGLFSEVDRNLAQSAFNGVSDRTLENIRKELERMVRVNEAIKFTEPSAYLKGRYAAWLLLDKNLETWFESWKKAFGVC